MDSDGEGLVKEGKADPSLTLIRVVPEQAYYWATKHSKAMSMAKIIGAIFSDKMMDDGVQGTMTV